MFTAYIDLIFSVWERALDNLKKPYAALVLFVMLVIAGFVFADFKRTSGYQQAKKDDSVLIATKDYQIKYSNAQISTLKTERDTLQNRLNNFDCAKETQKWNELFKSLQNSVVTKRTETEKSLELERERTREMEKTLKSL